MKKIFILLALISVINPVNAEKSELKWLDLELSNYSYPYEVSNFNLQIQGQSLNMAYMDVTPKNYNNKNIVLMHGKNFNGAYWETTINSLINKGFRVIVPDQIGFGKSSKPDYFQYTFHQLAQNTKSLLNVLNIKKASILGHSMGGMLATRFALMYPDSTESLILVNPIGLEDWKLEVPYKPADWWYQNELNKTRESIKSYQLSNYYDNNWKPEYDEWVDLLAGWTLNSNYETIAWNAALTYEMIFTQPVIYELSHISSPTLLIIGTRDRTALGKSLVSAEKRKMMGRYDVLGKKAHGLIPNAKLIELKDTGHLPHIERFNLFIEPLNNFLESL